MKPLHQACRRFAHALFGDYGIYRIFVRDIGSSKPLALPAGLRVARVEKDALANAGDQAISELAGYAGQDAWCFALLSEGMPVSACAFWAGERYRARNFWPLREREAKLVQINTATKYQGRGYAPMLIKGVEAEMDRHGFDRLYARVWHNNRPSITAFEKANWVKIALAVELFPFGRLKPLRYVWRHKESGS